MHLQRTETQTGPLTDTCPCPAAACYGGWQKTPRVIMADFTSTTHSLENKVTWPVRSVLEIRSQFIGSWGYRRSTDHLALQPGQTTRSPLHPCDPNPGPGQLKAQDWKTRMNKLSQALEKLLRQQTDWIRREKTSKQEGERRSGKASLTRHF